MPYSGPSDPSLPENVKKLPDKVRRQWLHVWQGEMDEHHDERRAFAAANGVVKKNKDDEAGENPKEEASETAKQEAAENKAEADAKKRKKHPVNLMLQRAANRH